MLLTKMLLVVSLATLATSAAIPIWELLTKQEKMGRLMYVFIHLVDQYCKESNIPDCQKVLTLYGMSNLVNEEENSLDYMDPYQRDSRGIIWEKVMKGDFKLPSYKTFYPEDNSAQDYSSFSASDEDYDIVNEVRVDGPYPTPYRPKQPTNDPHPYAVRVPAPAKLAIVHAPTASHPYAVRVPAPEVATPEASSGPVGIKPSADFEPMMTESRTSTSVVRRVLPPRSSTPRLLRSRRASEIFPEEEMKALLSHVLRK